MWILKKRFSEDFGQRVYRKMNVVSENKNESVKINISDANGIREIILESLI
jgi:hypothetical protein